MKYSSTAPRVLGAFAALGAASVTTQADASIVYSGVINFSVPNNFDGVYINLGTGATGTAAAGVAGYDLNIYNSGTAVSFFWGGATNPNNGGVAGATTGPYLSLATGATIGPASVFANVTASTATTAFQTTGTNILGVRFDNGGTIVFGWLRLSSTATSGFPLNIVDYAFENSGAAITAGATGAIPEPSTVMALGMMAAGALGLRQWRNRKAA